MVVFYIELPICAERVEAQGQQCCITNWEQVLELINECFEQLLVDTIAEHGLFVQRINQFSTKRISADFIVYWPTRKWKINFARHISFFLSVQKKTQNSETRVPLAFFLNQKKQIQTYAFLFLFSEGNKEGILNHAFLIHLSEESIKGIQNDCFLFFYSEGNNKGIQCTHPYQFKPWMSSSRILMSNANFSFVTTSCSVVSISYKLVISARPSISSS